MKPGFAPILVTLSSADSPSTLLLSQAVLAKSSDALTKACASVLVFSVPLASANQSAPFSLLPITHVDLHN
jgi:hypothetical protein